jgi:hypothetical protein
MGRGTAEVKFISPDASDDNCARALMFVVTWLQQTIKLGTTQLRPEITAQNIRTANSIRRNKSDMAFILWVRDV